MGISVEPYLMVLVFICFILLLFFLNQWLYKPMLSFMDKRDERVKKDLQDTQSNTQEIAKIQEEISTIISQAQKKAKEIIEEATTREKALCESKIEAKRQELDSQMLAFKAELKEQQAQLKSELSAHVGEYKQAISEKLKSI